MKVRCLHNSGKDLTEKHYAAGHSPRYEYPVIIGREHMVYGMRIDDSGLSYLLTNDSNDRPDWFPAIFFEVMDTKIPASWHFADWSNRVQGRHKIEGVWGYRELAEDEKHLYELAEREVDAFKIWFERKKQIDDEFLSQTEDDT